MTMHTFELEPSREAVSLPERYANHPLATLETYKYFNQSSEEFKESREKFIDAVVDGLEMDAPTFEYPKINIDELMVFRDQLTEMLSEFPNDKELNVAERITRDNITNRLDEVSIMLMTKMQSELSIDDPRYEAVSAQLGINMQEVYGVPNAEHFRGVLGYRLSKIQDSFEILTDTPQSVVDALSYVRSILPKDLPVQKPKELNPEAASWYAAQLDERVRSGMDAVNAAISRGEITLDDEGKLDAQNIIYATRIILDIRGASRWNVVQTKDANIDTNQTDLVIYVPESRKMSLSEFDAVMVCHEVDEHVMRRENGDASGIPEIGGTDAHGYLAKEEGNGKINEALRKGKLSLEASAFGFFLSGGLILGLDREGRGRNMRETTEIVWRLNFIEDYLKSRHDGSQQSVRNAVDKATTHLTRLFRGTDGKVPGVAFTKDSKTYYEGSADVIDKWHNDMTLTEDQRKSAHMIERAAKYDITRREHSDFVEKVFSHQPYNIG